MPLTKICNQWPSGIPSYVRGHKKPVDELEPTTRVWRHFVREEWTPAAMGISRDGPSSRWATTDQKLRDVGFQHSLSGRMDIAINPARRNDLLFDLANTPKIQALLANYLISLFSWDGSIDVVTHICQEIVTLMPINDNLSTSNLLEFRESVARPNFLDMYMAQDGTLLSSDSFPKLIIDDRTLESGLLL
ncbi:uncharacterized protein N7482_010247 [Penicillium canariense]|uniref:Uncharacterized protein n=1 Tax=Penicillium canariense TaxID=189055 RepID=A0A9W9LEB4_9EURO|nr:uncharacterized protein N7482_010247 [Penicillium canariense]KAJ5150995.1 hypothetical protein N7482_010247 [Penicillium canariense]